LGEGGGGGGGGRLRGWKGQCCTIIQSKFKIVHQPTL